VRERINEWVARATAALHLSGRNRVRVVAIPLLIILCMMSFFWPRTQSLFTLLVLYVTLEYLIATREYLGLFRDHVQKSQRTFLYFNLVARDKLLRLRVSNLGAANCLVESMYVRKQDEASFDFDVQRVVEAGKTEEVVVPDITYRDEAFSIDLEFTLKFLDLNGSGKTLPRVFNVSMSMNNTPRQAVEQINGVWRVRCPKCRVSVQMKTFGLHNFEETVSRKQQLSDDLRATCPNHLSEWLLTLEDVQAQRLERLNRLEAPGDRLDDAPSGPRN
jgi:hypothetical protein